MSLTLCPEKVTGNANRIARVRLVTLEEAHFFGHPGRLVKQTEKDNYAIEIVMTFDEANSTITLTWPVSRLYSGFKVQGPVVGKCCFCGAKFEMYVAAYDRYNSRLISDVHYFIVVAGRVTAESRTISC